MIDTFFESIHDRLERFPSIFKGTLGGTSQQQRNVTGVEPFVQLEAQGFKCLNGIPEFLCRQFDKSLRRGSGMDSRLSLVLDETGNPAQGEAGERPDARSDTAAAGQGVS
jgi:hypothetical protein